MLEVIKALLETITPGCGIINENIQAATGDALHVWISELDADCVSLEDFLEKGADDGPGWRRCSGTLSCTEETFGGAACVVPIIIESNSEGGFKTISCATQKL